MLWVLLWQSHLQVGSKLEISMFPVRPRHLGLMGAMPMDQACANKGRLTGAAAHSNQKLAKLALSHSYPCFMSLSLGRMWCVLVLLLVSSWHM